jgi:hypothetical protein
MSSFKQIEANRQNALKSTGPTTQEGKQRSRRNALRHGLTAETVIAALENAEDYQAFEAAVTADYDAETAVERELVLRLASVLWRLRRATGVETALFDLMAAAPNKTQDRGDTKPHRPGLTLIGGVDLPMQQQLDAAAVEPGNEATAADQQHSIACRFLNLAELPSFPLDRLSRYEHLIWRQARQLVFTLESLRRRRSHQSHSTFPFAFRRREPSRADKSG